MIKKILFVAVIALLVVAVAGNKYEYDNLKGDVTISLDNRGEYSDMMNIVMGGNATFIYPSPPYNGGTYPLLSSNYLREKPKIVGNNTIFNGEERIRFSLESGETETVSFGGYNRYGYAPAFTIEVAGTPPITVEKAQNFSISRADGWAIIQAGTRRVEFREPEGRDILEVVLK